MPTAQDPTVTFRLDRKLKETLAKRAKQLGISLSDLIRGELAVLGEAVAGSGERKGASPETTAGSSSAPSPRASETVHFVPTENPLQPDHTPLDAISQEEQRPYICPRSDCTWPGAYTPTAQCAIHGHEVVGRSKASGGSER